MSFPFVARFAAYLLLTATLFEGLALALHAWGWKAVLRDGGLTENLEVAVLGLVIVAAAALAVRAREEGAFWVLFAAVGCLALFREFDEHHLYGALPNAVRVTGAGAIVLTLAMAGGRQLVATALAVLGRPSGLLLVLGGVLLLAWAQLLGQPLAWRALYQNIAPGRRLVEESLELAGYLFLFFGVLEEHRYRAARNSSSA